jgi:hypothetical protein
MIGLKIDAAFRVLTNDCLDSREPPEQDISSGDFLFGTLSKSQTPTLG